MDVSVDQERIFYVTNKLLNNALLGVPLSWLQEQMYLADVSFRCDFNNCYICLSGVSRDEYLIACEDEKDYFKSEYRIKDFLRSYMARAHCFYEFFYHFITKEHVILFTPAVDSPPAENVAQSIHGFVSQQIESTMPSLSAKAGHFTVLSPHISDYTQLCEAFQGLQRLKKGSFFHPVSALFTPSMLQNLQVPLSLKSVHSTINQIERLVIARNHQAVFDGLYRLICKDIKYCFDFQLAEETCAMLRLLLYKWQSAYGFRLEERSVNALSVSKHLTVESLHEAAHDAFSRAMLFMIQADRRFSLLTQETLDILYRQYHEPLSLNRIAQQLHVSCAHLSRVFKNDLGISFSKYLMKIRLEQALSLLKQTHDSVGCIASKVGIDDSAYFHRLFRQYTGMTPRQYRESQGKNVAPYP